MTLRPALVLVAGAALLAAPALGQDAHPATFTPAQADRGQDVYNANCAVCHGANLQNPEFAPSLDGALFKRKWGGQSAAGLFSYVKGAMPPDQPGSLAPDDYAAVLAYLIRANGGSPGPAPLPSDTQALSGTTLPGG